MDADQSWGASHTIATRALPRADTSHTVATRADGYHEGHEGHEGHKETYLATLLIPPSFRISTLKLKTYPSRRFVAFR